MYSRVFWGVCDSYFNQQPKDIFHTHLVKSLNQFLVKDHSFQNWLGITQTTAHKR